ncbi:MAG TPA: glucosylceramidase, partial [Chitinophagaceae bacterium]
MRIFIAFALFFAVIVPGCKKDGGGDSPPVDPAAGRGPVAAWLTNANQSALFARQAAGLKWGDINASQPSITLDSTQVFQSIEGFGFTLTGGSADVLSAMPAAQRHELLQELFGTDSAAIGISYLRLSIGASDLSDSVFSYDDVTPGGVDTALAFFALGPDT